jgi:signal transduction histidine kinase/CheY-like chemotaxis protein
MKQILLGRGRPLTIAYLAVSLLLTLVAAFVAYGPMTSLVAIRASDAYAYGLPERLYAELTNLSLRSAQFELHEGHKEEVRSALEAVRRTYQQMVDEPGRLAPIAGCESYASVMSRLGWYVQIAQDVQGRETGSMRPLREDAQSLIDRVGHLAEEARAVEATTRIARFSTAHSYRLKTFYAMLSLLALAFVAGWAFLHMWRIRIIEDARHQALMTAEREARAAQHQAELALHTFLGKVSHEINSPLQTILTNIQLMEASYTEDARVTKLVGRLKTSVTHLRAQITDLLDVSEIKSGKLNIKLEAVDVAKLVESTVSGLQGNADIKGVALTLKTESLMPAQADGRRIAQIITNLVSNAIRYTENGEVYVAARMFCQEGRPLLNLLVADTGIGMSAETQEQLFQPFMRNSGAKRKGTGLGLSIVKGLVEQMQGEISFASTEGFGTEFYVTLPLLEIASPVFSMAAMAQEAPAIMRSEPTGQTVLFADDDECIRLVVTDLLTEFGYSVVAVDSAAQARKALDERQFQIILLDMELGDGNGADVAIYAKMTANSFAPIVAMTAYPDLYRRQLMTAFEAQLGKPVEASVLRSALQEVSRARAYARPRQRTVPPFPGYTPEHNDASADAAV